MLVVEVRLNLTVKVAFKCQLPSALLIASWTQKFIILDILNRWLHPFHRRQGLAPRWLNLIFITTDLPLFSPSPANFLINLLSRSLSRCHVSFTRRLLGLSSWLWLVTQKLLFELLFKLFLLQFAHACSVDIREQSLRLLLRVLRREQSAIHCDFSGLHSLVHCGDLATVHDLLQLGLV